MTPRERAAAVAQESLLANLRVIGDGSGQRTVLVAGSSQYNSVWLRDFCFASGGLMIAGRRDAVEDTIRELIAKQRADGLYPRLLDSYSPFTRFVRATF